MSVLGSANYGRLDILVNNSGVYEFAPLEAITEESFHRLFNLNVLGLLLRRKNGVGEVLPDASSGVGLAAIQMANVIGAIPVALTRSSAKWQKLFE
jgi:3-oxoacyl-[acyl-carrier protein] reductase